MMFCDASDVKKEMGVSQAFGWSENDISEAIKDATDEIEGELLAGSVSEANVQLWLEGDTPVLLKKITAKRAGAMVLWRHSMNSDTAKQLDSRADKMLKSLLQDRKSVLFNSDNEAIASADEPIRSSEDGKTPKLSIGDSGLGTTGTLDKMDE